ncbi:MAG: tetratricopeptide repeat protein [Deltaproteobacteria bacterium]|nr:tetratricopeptide repeat protein [Deltaproteobacteria bacterium]
MEARKIAAAVTVLVLVLSLAACGGPEEKKARFLAKAKELYSKGDYVKARLEVKNAIQIDPKYAEGYHLLGLIEEKDGNLKGAFGAFSKAIELNPELTAAHVEMGKLLLVSGAPDKAFEKAQAALARQPANSDALMLKGSILMAQKKPRDAAAIFEGLLQKGEKKPETYLLLAMAYSQSENPSQAEKTLAEGIAAYPGYAPLHLGLAQFYSGLKQPDKVKSELQKVIQLEPDKAIHKFNLANFLWEEGRQAAAIDLITETVATDAANEGTCEMAARFFISKKQLYEAAKILDKGVEKIPASFKLRILLADVFLNQGNPSKAIETLEKCLSLSKDPGDPGIIQAKTALTRVHLLLRQTARAEAYVNQVLEANPKSVEGHLAKGDIYMVKGEGQNAVAEFRTVVGEQPQFIAGYIRLASAHVLNRELDLAVQILQNSLKLDPKSKETLQALSRVYGLKKDMTAAEEQLRRIVDMDAGDMAARANLGDFLAASGKTAQAEAAYRTIVQHAPQSPLGYLKLSRLYRMQNKPRETLAQLEEGYRQNQVSAELLTELVQTYIQQKKHGAGVAVCTKRIEDNPRDIFAYNLLGWVYTDMKNYQEAEAALKKAVEMQPLWPAPHTNLANLYLLQGRKQEAIEKLQAGIDANPKDASGYLTLALLFERDKDYTNAMQVYERALKENPGFWFASNNLAFLMAETNASKSGLQRAKMLVEEALKARPNEASLLDTLGWVYFRMGDTQQARSLIEQALAASPEEGVLNYHMGAVLAKLGQKDEAREKLEKSMAGAGDYPGKADAARLLKELS